MAKFCHVWKHTWNSIAYSNLRFGKKSGEILTFFLSWLLLQRSRTA